MLGVEEVLAKLALDAWWWLEPELVVLLECPPLMMKSLPLMKMRMKSPPQMKSSLGPQ
jgi:hypothetical protein